MPDTAPYLALYRKLRPKLFKDVIGQEHIVRTLKNQLASGRVSHAYLICGTRGTGKTTTAKIFARAVNCLAPSEGEPCNECQMCLDILEQRSMNVIEIDAASNNGVDNIRDIREEVRYPPTEGLYKVYIIDEVHMLSTGAFNALLKTLEEPPDHVIFILATTDPQKVPATIHSRCQRFDFKRIKQNDIRRALRACADQEGIDIADDAIGYLASTTDGAMRDALSIMDQCVSFYMGETITMEKVLDIVGSADRHVFFNMTDALNNHDGGRCLEIIEDLAIGGRDIGQFVSELLTHFRNILVAAAIGGETLTLDLSSDSFEELREQGIRMDRNTLMGYISTFSALSGQLRYSANDRILLEVTCIKLCNPSVEDSYEAIFSRLDKLENEMESGARDYYGAERSANAQDVVDTLNRNGAGIMDGPSGAARQGGGAGTADGFEDTGKSEMPGNVASRTVSEAKSPVADKVKKNVPDYIKAVRGGWKEFAAGFANPMRSFLSMTTVGDPDGSLFIIITKDTGSQAYLKKHEAVIREKLLEKYNIECMTVFMTNEEYELKYTNKHGQADSADDFNKRIKEKINLDSIEFV